MPKKSKKKIYKVAFQGEIGAFSEEAAFKFFGSNVQTIPCQTFSDVFRIVERGAADFGILPIENSLEGSVEQNYDLLLKSKIKIFGEETLRIRHCLIANEGVKIGSLKKVYSHPQALGQCREFLEKLKVKQIPFYDTAGSVKEIKEKKSKNLAAIAGKRAALAYEMEILKEGIETNPNNYTRFFIISNKEKEPTGKDKTSIVFAIPHKPGTLFNVLQVFANKKINLTKIESRPIMGKPWEYHFYLDFESHQEDKKIKEALKKLKEKTLFTKVLGSYPVVKWR